MEDTASLVQAAVTESTSVADNEPIPGDETPEAVASEEPSTGAEVTGTEPPAESEAAAEAAPVQQKRRGPIPYDRHEAVLTRTRNEAAKAQEALQARIDALAKYEGEEYQNRIKLMDLLAESPERAVAILKQVDPDRFGKLTWAEQQEVVAAAAAAAPVVGEKPAPDMLNTDGTLGYSAEAAEKLVEWRITNERASFDKEIKSLREEFSKEISPIKSERQAREAFASSVQRMTPVLENARKNWPEFTANEVAMREWLGANKKGTLDDAYRAVVVPKLVGDRKSIEEASRKKVIEELNAKGKSKGVIPGTLPAAGSTDDGNAPKSTADLVRAALRSAA